MALYTRRQLALLFTLLAAGGVGRAVQEWRAAYPDLAAGLEQFDRAPPAPPPGPPSADRARAADRQRGGEALGHRAPRRVDLNAATAEELTRLPGVGPVLALRILETRHLRGRFGSLDDLRQVKGLGGATVERLRPLVMIGESRVR
jgi:competence ComEA-like helix-hairpin-helix protein